MQIQVNSDKNIAVDTELTRSVEAEVNRAVGRFENQITRVEVHLSDANSHKPGLRDKRCLMEARPAGRQPLSVSEEAGSVEQAVRGAAGKLKNSLESLFGKMGR
jgi:hypothetical protein